MSKILQFNLLSNFNTVYDPNQDFSTLFFMPFNLWLNLKYSRSKKIKFPNIFDCIRDYLHLPQFTVRRYTYDVICYQTSLYLLYMLLMRGVFEEIPSMKNCRTTLERGRN